MSEHVQIRLAVPGDAAGIARTRIEGWRAAYAGVVALSVLDALDQRADEARFAARIGTEPEVETLVAVAEARDDDVVGFCTYGADRDDPAPGHGEVYALYVRPPAWGAGVGTQLLDLAVRRLRDDGYEQLRLWTLTDNQQARAFYESRGWRPDGTEQELVGLPDPAGANLREVRYVLRASLPDVGG